MQLKLIFAVLFCFSFSALVEIKAAEAQDNNQDGNREQVRQLLGEMSTATRTLNYTGLFTFEVGGSLDTYKIIHRVTEGQESETLQRLNGQLREVRREGNAKDCLSPGKQLLLELMSDLDSSSTLLSNYQFEIHSQQRIAERNATVVNLIPVNNGDRYGYSIGIDQKTKLPLKIVLIGPNQRYLERIQFIELNEGGVLSSEVDVRGSNNPASGSAFSPDCTDNPAPQLRGWNLAWLPNGFVFSGQGRAGTGDEMLTFTDGLASFSIFIGDVKERPPVREARAQLGATTVYMARRVWEKTPYSVTVVGEVPLATAQKVAASVNPQ